MLLSVTLTVATGYFMGIFLLFSKFSFNIFIQPKYANPLNEKAEVIFIKSTE